MEHKAAMIPSSAIASLRFASGRIMRLNEKPEEGGDGGPPDEDGERPLVDASAWESARNGELGSSTNSGALPGPAAEITWERLRYE